MLRARSRRRYEGPSADLQNTVDQHAVDIASLGEGQRQLGRNLDRTVEMVRDGFQKTESQILRVSEKMDANQQAAQAGYVNASKPNYQAIGLAFTVASAFQIYYVQSQTAPINRDMESVRGLVTANSTADISRANELSAWMRSQSEDGKATRELAIRNDEKWKLWLSGNLGQKPQP